MAETFHPNPHLNLETRTRYPTAETWDLKVFLPPANHPVSGFPLSGGQSRHLPPGAATRHPK